MSASKSYGATDSQTPQASSSSNPAPPAPSGDREAAKKDDKGASKIEPKVWFANERTWLNWSRTGVLLGTFGVALVNASPGQGAKALGAVYAFIAVATIWYGWVVYQKRLRMIKAKYPGHFDEPLVPILLGLALFLAVLVNFILRIADRERSRRAGSPKDPWIAAPARSAGLLQTQS